MAELPQCNCFAYFAVKQVVKQRFDEYDALVMRYKGSDRQLDKVAGQINVIRKDIARKAQLAFESPMIKGDKRDDLVELAEDFRDLVNSYEAMRADQGCPCCRGVEGLKKAAMEMLESANVLSESFLERTDTPIVPHEILMARRDDYEEKSDAACELRLESIDIVQKYLQFHRDFFGAFQCLQDALNEMMESVSMHNALMLLGEENSGYATQKKQSAKQESKKGKAAAKASAKGKKATGQSKPAKPSRAAASKEEGSDEEAAVESEVAHRNPFAALEAGGEGSSADSAADSASAHDSDSSSQHSSSSTAEMTHPAADARNGGSSAHFFPENEQQLSELDLGAQRQALLARLQSGGAAESATHVALGNVHAAKAHMGSGHALYGQLISAQKLMASLGGSQLAVQLVSHLCCPITGELIEDAVVAMDGHTYERLAIESWFEEQPGGFSFKTKKRLPSKLLLPNKRYKSLVAQLAG